MSLTAIVWGTIVSALLLAAPALAAEPKPLAVPRALQPLAKVICEVENASGQTDWKVVKSALPAKLPGWKLAGSGQEADANGLQQKSTAIYWQSARTLTISISDEVAIEHPIRALGPTYVLSGHSGQQVRIECKAKKDLRNGTLILKAYAKPVTLNGKPAVGISSFEFVVGTTLKVTLKLTYAASDQEVLGLAAHLDPALLAKARRK